MRGLTRIILLALPVLVASCSGHKDRFILRGTTADMQEGVILATGIDTRFDRIDTILIKKRKFTYKCELDTLTPILLLFQDGRMEPVFADKGEKYTLFSDSIGKITVNGSLYDQQYRNFIPAMMNDTAPEQILHHIDSFITLHPNSEVTPYLIYRYCVMEDNASMVTLSHIIDKLSGHMQENILISEISSGIGNLQLNARSIGKFSLRDTAFASYALGGLFEDDNVLLYVWSSWDKDSRQMTDSLTELAKRHSKESFSIAGISIDTDKERWKTAITEDSVSWAQYNDPAGWNSKIVNTLKIRQLPYFILLGKDHDKVLEHGSDLNAVAKKIVLPEKSKRMK